jgi:hypothetical protein
LGSRFCHKWVGRCALDPHLGAFRTVDGLIICWTCAGRGDPTGCPRQIRFRPPGSQLGAGSGILSGRSWLGLIAFVPGVAACRLPYAESRLFSNLSRTVPYTKTLLLPANAAGKRPRQSAITIARAGNIPRVNHHAAFQRQLLTDEQQTSLAARHYPRRDIHRRQDLSPDAVRPTASRNSLPHHHIRDYRF